MTVVDIQIAPIGHKPHPVLDSEPDSGPEIEMVDDLEILSEDNRCNCSASDDNPY